MRFIKKGKEPNSLMEYKKQSNAYYDGCNKSDIRKALLKEQGYLCAYCMRRISEENMTIEHYDAQSKISEKDALDYNNMLGVCLGNRDSKKRGNLTCDTHKGKEKLTCDAHRGNEVLTVNPFEKATIDFIKYDNDGKIYSENSNIDKDLNLTLNLNCRQVLLKENRRKALEALKKKLIKLKPASKWNREFLKKIIRRYEAPDANGKFEPYSGIILYYLKKKLDR
ncbi:retron system putative HNH endonuclease [Clostridium thailandense]|uniref:retron system putative HNH endonuclease n=1 Tax=Clostridium thailandense TaxID=2794346 RepID=UPI00398A3A2E